MSLPANAYFLEESTCKIPDTNPGIFRKTEPLSKKSVAIAPPPINTYRAEIEEFSAAILENREPSNSAVIGMQSQKVLAACYKSAKTGKVIKL